MNKNVMYCECAEIDWQNRKVLEALKRGSLELAEMAIKELIMTAQELQKDIERGQQR